MRALCRLLDPDDNSTRLAAFEIQMITYDDTERALILEGDLNMYGVGGNSVGKAISKKKATELIHEAYISGRVDLSDYPAIEMPSIEEMLDEMESMGWDDEDDFFSDIPVDSMPGKGDLKVLSDYMREDD